MADTEPATAAFDRRRHPCGCVTVFDLAAWRSRTIEQCQDHAARNEDRKAD